jgi:hypothetical protein
VGRTKRFQMNGWFSKRLRRILIKVIEKATLEDLVSICNIDKVNERRC